jgi:hypothetical protein
MSGWGGSSSGGTFGGGGFRSGTPSGREMDAKAPRYTIPASPNGLAQAKLDAEIQQESAGSRRPGALERFKRWFSARF